MSLRVLLAARLLRLAVIGSARGSCCLLFQIARGARCNENKKLAGSIASPANKIVACRYTIRKRRCLAPAAPAPRCTATSTSYAYAYARHAYPTNAAAATADAASAGSASCAAATTTASAEATASTASAAATASAGQLHAAKEIFFVVEETEGSEADVGNFLFTERDHHARSEIPPLLNVTGRYSRCRCASC
jgi:hypothetical protein